MSAIEKLQPLPYRKIGTAAVPFRCVLAT